MGGGYLIQCGCTELVEGHKSLLCIYGRGNSNLKEGILKGSFRPILRLEGGLPQNFSLPLSHGGKRVHPFLKEFSEEDWGVLFHCREIEGQGPIKA